MYWKLSCRNRKKRWSVLPFHLSAPAPLHCLACICAVGVARNRGWIWPQVKRYHKILQASTLLKGTTTFQKIQKKKQQKMREKMSQKHANVIKIPVQTVEIYIYIWIHDASFARDAIWDRKGAAVSFRWKRSLECTNRHQEVKSCSKMLEEWNWLKENQKNKVNMTMFTMFKFFWNIWESPKKAFQQDESSVLINPRGDCLFFLSCIYLSQSPQKNSWRTRPWYWYQILNEMMKCNAFAQVMLNMYKYTQFNTIKYMYIYIRIWQ